MKRSCARLGPWLVWLGLVSFTTGTAIIPTGFMYAPLSSGAAFQLCPSDAGSATWLGLLNASQAKMSAVHQGHFSDSKQDQQQGHAQVQVQAQVHVEGHAQGHVQGHVQSHHQSHDLGHGMADTARAASTDHAGGHGSITTECTVAAGAVALLGEAFGAPILPHLRAPIAPVPRHLASYPLPSWLRPPVRSPTA